MQHVIIVHTLEQAVAALQAAAELKKPVLLQSASDAIFYAGALYLLHMFEQAKASVPDAEAHFIIDCADAGAEAVSALQLGHTHIRSRAPKPVRAKLASIAGQCSAALEEEPFGALDLLNVRNTRQACKEWIEKCYETS